METKVKSREWVKDAAIVFLTVLLVLTFFSNTIMNRTLPEVAAAQVTDGSIVARVRGTGTVTATGRHQVKAREIRTIRSVMIKVGQEVSAGDVLFVLGQGDSTELEQARETLRNLQASYQRAALNMPIYNYGSYERAIQTAERAYDRAMETLREAEERRNAFLTSPTAKAALARYEDAQQRLATLETEFADRRAPLSEAVDQAQTLFDARDEELQQADAALEALAAEGLGPGDPDYDAAQTARDAADSNRSTAMAALEAAQKELDTLNQEAYSSMATLREMVETYYYEYANQAGNIEDNYRDAQYAVEDAATALEAAYDNLYTAQQENARTAQSAAVELELIAESIRLQQERIRSLAGDEENVITADVSGTVSTVDCTAGGTVLKDAVLCTIEVPDMGYTLSFSVTNDQAQRLRIGDSATVSNYYWGNSVTATLTAIRTDPKNPQGGKLLVFDLSGDVTSGTELTISVGQKSANYDLIVPNSAIKTDTNGSFVLAVTAKNSPLGNRYTARRVSVEILASDDNNSAVVADLAAGDFVITTSSAPIKSGDMIRLADS